MNDSGPTTPPKAASRRGTDSRVANRFSPLHLEPDPEAESPPDAPATQFLPDHSATVISRNDSPDLGFEVSLNPYRGCEHGCAYCYARPTHEYLGFSAGLDFESKIMFKPRAPELLARELCAPGWQPKWMALSGVTDPYQPVESRMTITRRCLEVLAEFRQPVTIVTKNQLVARDIDLLAILAEYHAISVYVSITTLDPGLRSRLEPRTSPPAGRLAAIRALRKAGIPVGVLTAPIIPGLNDSEIPAILNAAAEAGASFASYTLLRLPLAVKPIFLEWLDRAAPLGKNKILANLRDVRDGHLNSSEFGERMRGTGPAAQRLRDWFRISRTRSGLAPRGPELSSASFQVPPRVLKSLRESKGQLELF
ncbi:MAG: PA0069 family radical SAM protein [Verrucomicrobia bacterium]|nr:PA0069 family radical SAM protein [Verrucomicrobiota bacterium]